MPSNSNVPQVSFKLRLKTFDLKSNELQITISFPHIRPTALVGSRNFQGNSSCHKKWQQVSRKLKMLRTTALDSMQLTFPITIFASSKLSALLLFSTKIAQGYCHSNKTTQWCLKRGFVSITEGFRKRSVIVF